MLIVALVVVLGGLELGAIWLSVRWTDQRQHLSQHKLEVALLTFYHSPRKGQSDILSMDALSENTIIGHPASFSDIPFRLGRVRYRLSGDDSYEFYVRQFANTLTWTYGGADNSSTARAQAVDSLVARLQELEGR